MFYREKTTKYKFLINICGPLSNLTGKFTSNADEISSIQLKPSEPSFVKSIGQYTHSKLTYSNGELKMLLDNGDLCGTKLSRKTMLFFQCAANASDQNQIKFLYENDCVYYFEWPTRDACILDCSLEHANNLYDLSNLVRSSEQFWPIYNLNIVVPVSVYTNIILNVCDKLQLTNDAQSNDDLNLRALTEKCSRKSSICAFNQQTGVVSNLGQYTEDLSFDVQSNSLRLVYANGDKCLNSALNKTTVLNFICDLGVDNYPGMNKPQLSYVSGDECRHEIHWRTSEACAKNRVVTTAECQVKSNGNVLFDLSPLVNSNPPFYLAMHNHDLDEVQDLNDFEKPFTKYRFNVCGKRIQGTEFTFYGDAKQDEAKSSVAFRFTNTPQLIYENGLLYFKYENASEKRYAFVKLECSFEASDEISSNSRDFELMQHLFSGLIANLNVDRSEITSHIAFMLWKTRHACLRGASNQVASHFQPFIPYDDYDMLDASFEQSRFREECIVYFDEQSRLFDLNANLTHRLNNFVDLRVLLKKFGADEKDLSFSLRYLEFEESKLFMSTNKSSNFKLYTRLCVASLKCKSNSFGCVVANDGYGYEKSISLGSRLNSSSFSSEESKLVLSFMDGEICGGSQANYSFEIVAKCWSKDESLSFVRTSNNGCRLHFEWLSTKLCRYEDSKMSNADANECKINDPWISPLHFQYNFKKLSANIYNVTDQSGRIIKISPICTSKLEYRNGLISTTSSGGNGGSTVRVEFYCDYNEERDQIEYLNYEQGKNEHVVGLYTYLACPSYLTRQGIDFKCGLNKDNAENLLFKLRVQNFRLVFKVCDLLPNANKHEDPANSSYGACFDKYGFALGSACLYNENVREKELPDGTFVVKQTNMGISKGKLI